MIMEQYCLARTRVGGMNNMTSLSKTVIVQTEELHTERTYTELKSIINGGEIPNEQ